MVTYIIFVFFFLFIFQYYKLILYYLQQRLTKLAPREHSREDLAQIFENSFRIY